MKGTPLSREILLEKGFEVKTMEGKDAFVKDEIAIVFTTKWEPCRLEAGRLISTNMYIDTWEELEKLMQEGGINENF